MNAFRIYSLVALLGLTAPLVVAVDPVGPYPVCEACGCSFCAPGLMMTNATATFSIPERFRDSFLGLSQVPCGTIQSLGLTGTIPPEVCIDEVRLFKDFRKACGCPPAVVPPPTVPSPAPITPAPVMPVLPPPPPPTSEPSMAPSLVDFDTMDDDGPADDDDQPADDDDTDNVKPVKGGKKAKAAKPSGGQEKTNKTNDMDDDDDKIAKDNDNDDNNDDDDDDDVPVGTSKGEKSSKSGGGGSMKRRVRRVVAQALGRNNN